MPEQNLGLSTKLLTDELIRSYSGDRVITSKGNINLKRNRILTPVKGGLYDAQFFGSIYKDACNCRTVKEENVYCHNCGSMVLDENTRNSRFARIELPYAYVPYFKTTGLLKTLKELFVIKLDFQELVDEVSGRNKILKALDLGQVEIYFDKKERAVLRLHDSYTDIKKTSYEGLISEMMKAGLQSEAQDVKQYIDNCVLVTPASMRGVGITTVGGNRELSLPYSTAIYTSILFALEQLRDKGARGSIEEEVAMRAAFRLYLRKALMELSEFTKSSKNNLARQMFSARVNRKLAPVHCEVD